jgi:hypothetical protein
VAADETAEGLNFKTSRGNSVTVPKELRLATNSLRYILEEEIKGLKPYLERIPADAGRAVRAANHTAQ